MQWIKRLQAQQEQPLLSINTDPSTENPTATPPNEDKYINAITKEMAEMVKLCRKKRTDYASSTDPFENFELSGNFTGIETWQSIFSRLSEKFIRLSNLLTSNKPPLNESIEDSLRDLALLSTILLVYRKRDEWDT